MPWKNFQKRKGHRWVTCHLWRHVLMQMRKVKPLNIYQLTDPRERAEAYARIGMAKEAADTASQAKDGELLGRLKLTFAQNAAASSIFDTLRDRLSFQGVF
ncbi:Protein VACUOLELESS1 [Olea europaea subsp. europaea]|uniref:Protein VACUOLELESS1 n=1 Tax=Olea europaea subsp. europaea TaxID=158383 RepID=A0A8S0QLG5_OLEEU|nr:Protein VACUOLELESS1 [Olea europaea subsp. europaea]